MVLRDSYKKCHLAGGWSDFLSIASALRKHYGEQVDVVYSIVERIQLLGGVSLAMAADVAETTQIERPPRGREEVPVQLSRLLDAHQVIIRHAGSWRGELLNLGTTPRMTWVVSELLRSNELQAWFLSEHLLNIPLVEANESSVTAGAA